MIPVVTSRGSTLVFLALLYVVAFAINWPWEMLQMPAYVEMARQPWHETVLTCKFSCNHACPSPIERSTSTSISPVE